MSYILKFVSSLGEFEMGGGRDSFFRLSDVVGLGFPDVERQTVVYSGRRGEKTVSKRFLPRIITISGDVVKEEDVSKIIRVLSEEGTLYINSKGGERTIDVLASSVEEPRKIGDVTRMVIQFTADDPAFSDSVPDRQGVYERVNLVKGSFTAPCVFTRRVVGGNFINSGDLKSEPVITVLCNNSAGVSSTLILKNDNTGAKIELTHTFLSGDVITINTKTAEITDRTGKSVLSAISDDTYLTEFVMDRGNNNISVVSSELASNLQVVCEYKKKYLEALL